ncbi:TonB-dependent receptor domain-containing protein [Brevundimonas sp. PAMC22021]|uniref:TonB-dependent receptor domain-containing protein n=1 Tax=Brevundimonas sp. PAMC22021 TaxID=2861285 RepID=UPI001C62788B|nr:TonB-dependent receptor [Brevundimonas sp. PAMC22021]QYF86964.1 TonB-dependent receptor [Brevundimonas sp. PAMC22021]
MVTATATQRTVSDAPASVTVVGRDEIERRPIQDLTDVLRDVPGVTVNGAGLTRRGVSIRGMPSEHTLFLLDGRRVNAAANAIQHADFDLGWTPAAAIERVEVVRGPMSSLYGSEALGGVVNVITRGATDEWRGSLTTMGGLREDGRGGETYQIGAYAGGPLVQNTLGLSLYAETKGRNETPTDGDSRLSDLEDRSTLTGSATLSWTPDAAQRIDLTVLGGRDDRYRNALSTGARPTYYRTSDAVDRRQYALSHTGQWSWGETAIRAYRSELGRENFATGGQTATRPVGLGEDIVDGRATFDLASAHRVSLGGEWRNEQLEDAAASLSGQLEGERYALFIQDEWTLSSTLSLTGGARFDHHDEYGWQTSPRLYAVWTPTENLILKAGGGRGFKSPSLKQLSPEFVTVAAAGRFTVYGNPDLQPEIGTSYEVSAEYRRNGWMARAGVFDNDIEDLIETRCTAFCGVRGREVRLYQNIAEARIQGVELAAEAPLGSAFTLKADYTYLDSENRETGTPLSERPEHSGHATLRWEPNDAVFVQGRGEYVGEQWMLSNSVQYPVPDYTLVSLEGGYRLSPELWLKAGVQNLGDVQLADESTYFSFAEPGRFFYVGFTANF